jgi:hypothetical protein
MQYNNLGAIAHALFCLLVIMCTARIVEEQVFGRDHLSWISGSALAEAGVLADYLILRTGMTALGKVYYRTQQDLMVHVRIQFTTLTYKFQLNLQDQADES